MRAPLRALTFLVMFLNAAAGSAADYAGRIVGVVDGDTVDLLSLSKELHRIRLAGIDAPEKSQPFGSVAKRALSDLVFDRQVVVLVGKSDRYGRLVGKVLVAGTDANLQMVRNGFAWHYKTFAREQSPDDRERYAAAEVAARFGRQGLWVDAHPIAPWDFRDSRRHGGSAGFLPEMVERHKDGDSAGLRRREEKN